MGKCQNAQLKAQKCKGRRPRLCAAAACSRSSDGRHALHRIVNKEWEYSHKRGFKCTFDRGILHVYFNFKRTRYRR